MPDFFLQFGEFVQNKMSAFQVLVQVIGHLAGHELVHSFQFGLSFKDFAATKLNERGKLLLFKGLEIPEQEKVAVLEQLGVLGTKMDE